MPSSGREFDPNKKYKVVLSERLKNNDSNYSSASIHVDPDLKIPSSVKSSDIKRVAHSEGEWNLRLVGSKAGESYNYIGSRQSTKTCALIFDPDTQTFILDRIDAEFSFSQDQTAASDGSESEDGILSALVEQEGEPDSDNPYDWRHQLKRRRSSSPELEPFDPLSLDAIGTSPSPEPGNTNQESHRQASTPPGEFDEEVEQEYAEDLESQESSDDGGLQIVMDGANEPRNRYNRGRFFERTEGGGPISLRSAANSRSPAVNDQESSEESDVDVDEMKLGSPMRKENGAGNVEEARGDVDMGDADEELEEEFERLLEGGDDGEGPAEGGGPAPAAGYVDDSSSESEEE